MSDGIVFIDGEYMRPESAAGLLCRIARIARIGRRPIREQSGIR